MFLPIVGACWLFRYRGLLISLALNGLSFQIIYLLLLKGTLPDSAFVLGGIIGFGTSLGLGLVVCWLRTAVDQVQVARQQAILADQERMNTLFQERQAHLAYEQQRTMNALKDQFMLNINHELRTPLTLLGGTLELIKEFDEQLDPLKRAHLLKEAIAGQEELVHLVDRVLDASKIIGDVPAADLEIVNLQQALQEVLAHMDARNLADYTIHIQISEQLLVWADPQFLRQIIRNLISNIFKYVPTRTGIHIEASQAATSSLICLSIQDEGLGIPPAEQPLLFEKFVRLKRDLASSTRGTGLGLYICKQLIEAMGGRIWVQSSGRAGEGCRFCILLPPAIPA
jgi:signal transduction histidine kinase